MRKKRKRTKAKTAINTKTGQEYAVIGRHARYQDKVVIPLDALSIAVLEDENRQRRN